MSLAPGPLDFRNRDPMLPYGYEAILIAFGGALTYFGSHFLNMVVVMFFLFSGFLGKIAYVRMEKSDS